jgi:hypothetical protein
MNMQNHATSSKLNGGIDETKKKWWQKLFWCSLVILKGGK